jgi:hypothetical protein
MQKFDMYLTLAKTIAMKFEKDGSFKHLINDIQVSSEHLDFNTAASLSERLNDLIANFVMNLQSLSLKHNDSLIHISLSSDEPHKV